MPVRDGFEAHVADPVSPEPVHAVGRDPGPRSTRAYERHDAEVRRLRRSTALDFQCRRVGAALRRARCPSPDDAVPAPELAGIIGAAVDRPARIRRRATFLTNRQIRGRPWVHDRASATDESSIVTGAGTRHRPGARARVRPPGRQGRGQRPRRRARRAAAARTGPAGEVVDEIRGLGGEAVANGDDVADWDQRRAPRRSTAVDAFGAPRRAREQRRLPPRPHARQHGRGRVGRGDPRPPQGPLLPAAPRRGLLARAVEGRRAGSTPASSTPAPAPGSSAASARAPTPRPRPASPRSRSSQAAELGRYGVTANAIAPAARTRMTEAVFADTMAAPERRASSTRWRPRTSSPLVVWLGSADSAGRHRPGVRGRGRARSAWPTAGSTAPSRQGRPLGPGRGRPRRARPPRQGARARPRLRRRAEARLPSRFTRKMTCWSFLDQLERESRDAANVPTMALRAPIERPSLLWRGFVIAGFGTMKALSFSDTAWAWWRSTSPTRSRARRSRGVLAGASALHAGPRRLGPSHRRRHEPGSPRQGAHPVTFVYGFPALRSDKRAAIAASSCRRAA